jgi:hypothetical protein
MVVRLLPATLLAIVRGAPDQGSSRNPFQALLGKTPAPRADRTLAKRTSII